jgi:hypothetical protein
MGKSSEDHTPVIEHYLQECRELMEGFDCYFGETNKIERMALGMVTWNADRPERQMILNTLKEGTYGLVSGWAVKVSEEKFPDCIKCYRKRVLEMIGDTEVDEEDSCTQCFNWTLDPDDKRQRTSKPDKYYPRKDKEESSDEEGSIEKELVGRAPGQALLGPVKLSTDFLRAAVKRAYNRHRQGRWGKLATDAYLKSCNINEYRIQNVIGKAEQDRANGCESEPEAYEPGVWNQVKLERFMLPDLPMHGLAHGIIPDVMEIIHHIFARHMRLTAYYKFANQVLADIESFGLDWCKVKSLPKAAWIAENSMAYMRVFSFLQGMFMLNCPLASKETAFMKKTVSNLKCMLNALQALISVLMAKTPPDQKIVDNHMKLFMSSADYLHKGYGSILKGTSNGLSKNDLLKVLAEFKLNEEGTLADLRKRVNSIKVADLRQKCDELDVDSTGTKTDVQTRLFEHIIEMEKPKGSKAVGDVAKSEEKRCWNKGNWLSFTANIAEQIKYLGPLFLLW